MLPKLFAVCLLAVAGQANAGLITTSIGTYDVSTISTSVAASAPLLTSQVWWANQSLANEFAGQTVDSLGLPNIGDLVGPLFLGSTDLSTIQGAVYNSLAGQVVFFDLGGGNLTWTFAIATKVTTSVPEPGTLSLLGAGLVGLMFLRRRRIA